MLLPGASDGGSRTWMASDPPPGEETVAVAPVPGPAAPGAPDGAERFVDQGLIARGGMGEVRRVLDRRLQRRLAMKVIAPERSTDVATRLRFEAEARATAQLQHPGIVPVHEVGQLPDGRPYFTMREVRGRTLTRVIAAVHGAPDAGPAPFRRLVEAFHRACEAVAYAHSRGVLHRDLKPDNIMVGAFGEVVVLDWGIARVEGIEEGDGEADDGGEAAMTASAGLTRAGAVAGTPAYMAPEQARGQVHALDPRTDVYALGAVLFEVLTGRCARRGDDGAAIVRAVATTPAPDPAAHPGALPVPDELAAACRRAMASLPVDRFPDAAALAEALAAWLDGARRREQALERVARSQARRPEIQALRDRADDLDAQAAAALEGLPRHAPADRFAAGWALQDQAAELRRQAEAEALMAHRELLGALSIDPSLPSAHAILARRYRAELATAERERAQVAGDRAETLLAAHVAALPADHPDRADHEAWLAGTSWLDLQCTVPGASATLYRWRAHQRRLLPERIGPLPPPPWTGHALPHGSYVVVLSAPGRATVRLPVELFRGEHRTRVPPGGDRAAPVPLPRRERLGPDDRVVPAGWSWAGGPAFAATASALRPYWCDGFVARRFLVTNREYLAFLHDLVDQGREEDVQRWAPRQAGVLMDVPLIYGRGDDGRFFLQPDEDGDLWGEDFPVACVDVRAAAAFARWEAARTGQPWRLPSEHEWGRLARGADRRLFPWGDHFHSAWANTRYSAPGRVHLASAYDFPQDRSPFGARNLAGHLEEWTATPHGGRSLQIDDPRVPGPVDIDDRTPWDDTWAVRGGHWSGTGGRCHVTARVSRRTDLRATYIGFRLVRSLEAADLD